MEGLLMFIIAFAVIFIIFRIIVGSLAKLSNSRIHDAKYGHEIANPDSLKNDTKAIVQAGKFVAKSTLKLSRSGIQKIKDLKRNIDNNNLSDIEKLERLDVLRNNNVISEDEYNILKEDIIKRLINKI